MNSMDAMTKGLKMLHQDKILTDLMRMNDEYRKPQPQGDELMTLVEHIAEMNKEATK